MKKRWSDSDSKDWVVIDLNTVTIITNCVWADDDSGEYEVVLTDNNGEFITENGRIKTEKRRGKIKIVKRGKGWDRISFYLPVFWELGNIIKTEA